jgi:hypothetical protein
LHVGQDTSDAGAGRWTRGLKGVPDQHDAGLLSHGIGSLDADRPHLNLAGDLEGLDGALKGWHDAEQRRLRVALEPSYPGIARIAVAERVAAHRVAHRKHGEVVHRVAGLLTVVHDNAPVCRVHVEAERTNTPQGRMSSAARRVRGSTGWILA